MYFNKSLFAIGCLIGLNAFSQGTPDRNEIDISDLKYGGSGCKQGTVETIVTPSKPGSNNADYFQLVYDDFTVKSGPETSRRDRSKNCNVTMNISFPKGYQFKFEGVSYEGFAELGHGIYGEFDSSYKEVAGNKVNVVSKIQGPFEDDFTRDDTEKLSRGSYSNCDGEVHFSIDSLVRIRGKASEVEGLITKDISSGLVNQYRMKWRKC